MNLNPLTGIASLFHLAAIGSPGAWSVGLATSVAVSIASSVLLRAVAIELHRRHDRLFVGLWTFSRFDSAGDLVSPA